MVITHTDDQSGKIPENTSVSEHAMSKRCIRKTCPEHHKEEILKTYPLEIIYRGQGNPPEDLPYQISAEPIPRISPPVHAGSGDHQTHRNTGSARCQGTDGYR